MTSWGRREPEPQPRPALTIQASDDPPAPKYPIRRPEPTLAEPLGCLECPAYEAADYVALIKHQDAHLRAWRDEALGSDRKRRQAIAVADAALATVQAAVVEVRELLS